MDHNSVELPWMVDSFFLLKNGSSLKVKLSLPQKSGSDWKVQSFLERVDQAEGTPVYGIDAVQAILMSFARIRALLEKVEPDALFEGRHSLHSAFPRFVPFAYGDIVRQRIEKFVDAEIDNWLRQVEQGSRLDD